MRDFHNFERALVGLMLTYWGFVINVWDRVAGESVKIDSFV